MTTLFVRSRPTRSQGNTPSPVLADGVLREDRSRVGAGWTLSQRRAQQAAALLVHQPDLLLVSDRLSGTFELELVRRARSLAPATVVAVHLAHDGLADAAVRAGADAVYSSRITAAQIADALRRLLPPSSPRASGDPS